LFWTHIFYGVDKKYLLKKVRFGTHEGEQKTEFCAVRNKENNT